MRNIIKPKPGFLIVRTSLTGVLTFYSGGHGWQISEVWTRDRDHAKVVETFEKASGIAKGLPRGDKQNVYVVDDLLLSCILRWGVEDAARKRRLQREARLTKTPR